MHVQSVTSSIRKLQIACITDVPWRLEALGGVDVGEALLEERVTGVGDAVIVDVVARGDDEVDVQHFPNHSHLRTHSSHREEQS